MFDTSSELKSDKNKWAEMGQKFGRFYISWVKILNTCWVQNDLQPLGLVHPPSIMSESLPGCTLYSEYEGCTTISCCKTKVCPIDGQTDSTKS